jgi:hypothetical protein
MSTNSIWGFYPVLKKSFNFSKNIWRFLLARVNLIHKTKKTKKNKNEEEYHECLDQQLDYYCDNGVLCLKIY